MSTYDLEQQETLAEVKAWWRQHGNLIVTGLTIALALIAAWNGWNWYQRNQAGQAAGLYDTLQKAARANDIKAVRDASGSILENFPRTAYASLAALIAAKVNFQAGDLKTARAQLAWAAEHAKGEELRAIARLRLASVLLDDNAADEALKTLEATPPPSFEASYASLRGDILVAQKKPAEARAAYKAALEKADFKDGTLREILRMKLEALGEA